MPRPRWFTRQPAPDELPRSAVSDGPLSLRARAFGRGGLTGKLLLAAIGLLFLFGVVAAMWAGSRLSRRGALERPPSQVSLTHRPRGLRIWAHATMWRGLEAYVARRGAPFMGDVFEA